MSETSKTQANSSKSAIIGPILGIAALLFIMLFQGGAFATGQIEPGLTGEKALPPQETITVSETSVPVFYQSIGTVRSRDEVEIVPRIIARILEVNVRSGDSVKKGEVLAKLDAKDLSAVVSQGQQQLQAASAGISAADEQVKSAKAALDLATKEMNRTRALFEKNAAAKRDYDMALANYKQAEAGMQQAIQQKRAASANYSAAEQSIKQAEAGLGYATILSPIDGIVAERMADPGDLGNPASMIMRVFDPKSLMLEVPVRESLVSEITIGSIVNYDVPALNKSYEGTVKEIVPAVDPRTRTFLVKICIDNSPGLMPGMFGTLKVPLKTDKKVIRIPESAIQRTGQLESVFEIDNGRELKRQIRTIPIDNNTREIISGLRAGQIIIKNVNNKN
ncbi:MAG: HlyD family secretion protein [Clostridiales bacterium]|jgi:RND family efflux transporter MFP subunit|nr:HlyD family secretion protein [Clostridiales bacterium]MDN5281120.1 HlyD family secretion protein [Candidatus Ozemobacter sp.]